MSAPQATASDFALTFATMEGERVMNELLRLFGGGLWADTDGERARNIGRREVIEHIAAQIDKADPPPQRRGPTS